jgi:hypothetical protein
VLEFVRASAHRNDDVRRWSGRVGSTQSNTAANHVWQGDWPVDEDFPRVDRWALHRNLPNHVDDASIPILHHADDSRIDSSADACGVMIFPATFTRAGE